jgi:hypothetical protein
MQTKPAQIFHDRVAKLRAATRSIQIFDPKEKRSAPRPATLLSPPKSNRVTNVQIASRRRSEAAAIGRFFQNADFDLKSGRRNLKSPA